MKTNNLIVIGVVLLVLVGYSSWTASAYVYENNRMRAENVVLKSRIDDLKKDLERYTNGTGYRPSDWRPGNPIGNPAGAGRPVGSTPDGK